MTTTITDHLMTSTVTEHYAHRDLNALPGWPAWRVTWLPGQLLDRNQAITAMTLAEIVAVHCPGPGDRDWGLVEVFAAELGLDVEEAVAAVLGTEVCGERVTSGRVE